MVSLNQQSAAIKVVGSVLLVMFVIKMLFPGLVLFLEREWSSFVTSHSEPFLVLVGFIVFSVTYWSVGLVFLMGPDLNHVPAFLWNAKYQKTREFSVSGSSFNPSLSKTVVNALTNQFFVFLPGFFLLHFASKQIGLGLNFSPVLPSLSEVAKTAVFLIVLVEVGFYYSHRLLHSQALYRFHKQHHSYVTPIALASIYAHPVEAFLSSVLSIIGPAFLVFTHLSIFYLAIFLGWGITCISHSGYQSPLNGPAHDLHHSKNTGNFGLTGILDVLHGTRIKV